MSTHVAVTMNTVAKALGVVPSTVSKALRDEPGISEALKRRIKRKSAELGYRPNPMISTLMAQLHSKRRRTDPHHLAWLDLWPRAVAPTFLDTRELMLKGANQRADELGFRIEVHRPSADNISPIRLRQILTARTQWGVIVPPVPDQAKDYPLDMRGLAGVTIGFSLHSPQLHRVAADHFQGTSLAFDRLQQGGFERIGLLMSPDYDERVGRKSLGAYLAAQHYLPLQRRLPPLLVGPNAENGFVAEWLNRNRPDALLISEPHVLKWKAIARRVADESLRIGWLSLGPEHKAEWGIDYQSKLLGGAAVDLVVGQIHRNERGVPGSPNLVMIRGVWVGDQTAAISSTPDVR